MAYVNRQLETGFQKERGPRQGTSPRRRDTVAKKFATTSKCPSRKICRDSGTLERTGRPLGWRCSPVSETSEKKRSRLRYFISSSAGGREVVRPCLSAGSPLVESKTVAYWSLDFTYRRRRTAHPQSAPSRELCLAQSLHFVIAQTAPGQAQPSHETTRLWLEYRLPPRSPVRQNDLVTAGPGRPGQCHIPATT